MPVTTTLDAVDKINIDDDERLDKPDTLAIQELGAEYTIRMLGAVGGGATKSADSSAATVSGSVNTVGFDVSTVSAVSIFNACMLLNYRQNAQGDEEGQVVWYDPTDPGQQTTIDLSSFAAGSQTPYIWAKRFDIPDDADTRKKWVASAEATFSLATRQRHRVEWAAEVGDRRVSTGDNRWFIVAQVTSWSGGFPTILTWHPFDAGSPSVSGISDSWTTARLNAAGDASTLGINQAMRLLLTTLARMRKADGSVHPTSTDPVYGLDDLKAITDGLGDAFGDLGATDVIYFRLIADGVGGWALEAGDTMSSNGITVLASMSGWRVDVSMSVATIRNVQLTTGVSGSTVKDILVQYEPDLAVTLSRGITIYIQTLDNLINTTSFSWGTAPAGSPPFGVRIDCVIGA